MEYGLEHFEYQSVKGAGQKFKIRVTDGIPDSNQKAAYTYAEALSEQSNLSFLLADWESVQVHSDSIAGSCPGRDRSGNDRISGQRRNSCQTSGSNPKVCGKN